MNNPATPEDYALAETVVHASNLVSHNGFYEVDIDRAAAAIARHRSDEREALVLWLSYQIQHGHAPDGDPVEMTHEYALGRKSAFQATLAALKATPTSNIKDNPDD